MLALNIQVFILLHLLDAVECQLLNVSKYSITQYPSVKTGDRYIF